MEIERKFLIPDISKINLNLDDYKHKTIQQDYLYVDSLTAIRKRKIVTDDNTTCYYTIKTGKKGISVNEIENEIDNLMYAKLQVNPKYNSIIKERYLIPYVENLTIELDIFKGIYDGIAFAEIEYKDENQVNQIKLPEWFGKEISTLVTNSDMAINPNKTIFNILQE